MFEKPIFEVGTEDWARDVQRPHVPSFNRAGNHNPAYCCASVHDEGRSVTFHQCSRKPKVYYGALGYCAQHDPKAVLASRHASLEKWQVENQARQAGVIERQRKQDLNAAALAAIRQIAGGHNDPMTLSRDVLAAAGEWPPAASE